MIGRGNSAEPEMTGGKHRRDNVVPIRPDMLGAIMGDRPAHDARAPVCTVSYPVGRTIVVPCCPGCGATNWLIGRVTAECRACELVLPLDRP